MPIYEIAPRELHDQVEDVIGLYHGDLRDAEVTFGVLLAEPLCDESGEPTGPAVRVRGHEVVAAVRVVNYRDRVAGLPDVQIVIDRMRWDESSEAERQAVIDHLCESLHIKRDSDGAIIRDDLDRPKLSVRHPERIVEWFDAVVRRNGSAAPEWHQFESIREHTRQQRFDFDRAPHDVEAESAPVRKSREKEPAA